MSKINCLELLEGRKNNSEQEKNHLFLRDNLLFHAVVSCTVHIYCENIT